MSAGLWGVLLTQSRRAPCGTDGFVRKSLLQAVANQTALLSSAARIPVRPMISQDEFAALAAQGYNRIPVVREVLSDLDTPLSVYLKLADAPYAYLFESVEGGETWGRYSIIGLPAKRIYAFRGHTLEVREHGEVIEARELADPFAEVE